MTSYNEQLQKLASEYERLHPGEEYTSRSLTEWAVRNGKLAPRLQDQISLLSKDVARALRTSHFTDPRGRRVRNRHCVKQSLEKRDGKLVQQTFWQNLEFASPTFMAKSLAQRRTGVVDELWQIKQDTDSYNEFFNKAADVQMEFDFTEDMAEKQFELDSDNLDDVA